MTPSERGRALLPLLLLLLIGLAVRLPSIASPPLDAHHVRQCDTASIARSFARQGLDLLHPRVDWAGPDGGVVESELPLYAGAVAVGWKALGRSVDGSGGLAAAWPRGLSVLGWLLGGVALLAWVRRRIDAPAWACLALYALSPLAIVYTRNIQPDAFAVGLLLLGLERVDAAADRAGSGREAVPALVGALLLGLAVASKGSIGFWLAPLPFLPMARPGARRLVYAALAVALLIPAAWYLHAHGLGAQGASFGIWGPGAHKWGGPALWFRPAVWTALAGTVFVAALSPLGAVGTAWAVWQARSRPELRPFAVGALVALPAALLATEGFLLHNYYFLPMVPFASVLLGVAGVEQFDAGVPAVWRAAAALVLAASLLLGVGFVREGLRIDPAPLRIARSASFVLPAAAPVVVVDTQPQTVLYLLDRRGWARATLTAEEALRLESYGAERVLWTERSPGFAAPEGRLAVQRRRPDSVRAEGWVAIRLYGDRLF